MDISQLAPLIDELWAMAKVHLDSPRTLDITVYDDGDCEIEIYHVVLSEETRQRNAVTYRSGSGIVYLSSIEKDRLTGRRRKHEKTRLTEIDAPSPV